MLCPVKLGELISEHMSRTGESLNDLATRAEAAGHPLHRGTFSKLRKQTKRTEFPEMSTVLAVAAALQIPPGDVALAAIESMGLDIEGHTADSSYARQFVTITSRLTPSAIKRVLSVTRSVAEALEAEGGPPDREPDGAVDDER